MARQYWVTPVPPFHTADGTALANSVTLTDISPGAAVLGAACTIWPGMIPDTGVEIEVTAAGQFSTTTGPPTLLLGVYYGGIAGVALAKTSAVATTASITGVPWQIRWRGVYRLLGTAGQIKGQGELRLATSLTAFTIRPIPETLAERTVTVDTSVAKIITIGAQWGTASASNTITCDDISVQLVT